MGLPRKSATWGVVQIDETGLCPVLVEAAPTGSQAKKSTGGALLEGGGSPLETDEGQNPAPGASQAVVMAHY